MKTKHAKSIVLNHTQSWLKANRLQISYDSREACELTDINSLLGGFYGLATGLRSCSLFKYPSFEYSLHCARMCISFITLNENVSPVVDISSMGVICNANRINGLDSLNAQTIIPTQNAEGELNAMTYVTKRVNLKQPASSIRVILDGFSPLSTDIKEWLS